MRNRGSIVSRVSAIALPYLIFICLFPGFVSSAVVTLKSIEIYNTHQWVQRKPAIYFQCRGENKTSLPDVQEAGVQYSFKGEESWQPLTELLTIKCKRCGIYKDFFMSDYTYEEWELCSSDFAAPDGNYTRFKELDFRALFQCKECSSLVKVLDPEELEDSDFEAKTLALLAFLEADRSFKNTNFLASNPLDMSTPSTSVIKASRGGKSSARLSGKNLLEHKISAAKASASAKIIALDSSSSNTYGTKRKAIDAAETMVGELKDRPLSDLLQTLDPAAKKEIGDLHPIDCIDEAGAAAWKALQYSLVAFSTMQSLSNEADRRIAQAESQLVVANNRVQVAESKHASAEKKLREAQAHVEELESSVEDLQMKDAQIASDVGAYYCIKSRVEMMEEYIAGTHSSWNIEDEKANMDLLYPNGNPGDELFKLVGLGEDEQKEEGDHEANKGVVEDALEACPLVAKDQETALANVDERTCEF